MNEFRYIKLAIIQEYFCRNIKFENQGIGIVS